MSIDGADQLRDLGRRLKAAGETGKGMRRDLLREIRNTTKGPVLEAGREGLRRRLPSRGGLAATAAKNLKIAARTRLSGNEVGVTVLASLKDMDLPKLEQGKLRHLTYGHRPWVTQTIPANVFSDAMDEVTEPVGRAVLKVVDDTMRRI